MASQALPGRRAAPAGGPRVLFVALVDYLGMERVPAALGALGAGCAILSPPGFGCLASRHVGRWYGLPAHRGFWFGLAFLRRRLDAAARDWAADLVVPLDDIAAQYLRLLALRGHPPRALRDLLERSFGDPAGYGAVCSRIATMRAAEAAGIRVPAFAAARDPGETLALAAGMGFPVVLKGENSCGGIGVAIARDGRALGAALARYHGGLAWARARRAAVRAFWHVAGLSETASAPPLLQGLAPGRPAMRTVSTWQGEVLAGMSFVTERVHPAPTGPSTMVRAVENAEMAEAVRRFVAAQNCSGFLSFDFMLEPATGEASLIEVNARPIGTTHLGARCGQDICAPLLARLGDVPLREGLPQLAEARSIALFPKELLRAPGDPERLSAASLLHDVPYDDPPMLAMHLAKLRQAHPDAMPAILQSLRRAQAEGMLLERIGPAGAATRPRAAPVMLRPDLHPPIRARAGSAPP